MKKENVSSPLFKIALLSLSLMLTTSGAISSNVNLMSETFVNKTPTAIEALVTASNFTVMIFVLLSSFFVKSIGTRKTVLLGLSLSFLAGIFPMFSNSYVLIYISRLVLGAGFGLFNSLAVSLIGKYYDGEEKNKLIGWQSAVQSAGQTIVTFLVGVLMLNGWHMAFAANFLGIIPLVLYFVWGSRDDDEVSNPENKQDIDENVSGKQKVNTVVILQSISLLVSFALIMMFFLKSSIFVAEENFKNPSLIGIVMSVYTLISIIANLFYGKIVKRTKYFSLPISYTFMGLGFILLSFTRNFFSFTVIVLIIGLGGALLLPYSWELIMGKAPKGSENLAISIAMVGTNIGAFLAPYFGKLPSLFFGNETAAFAFIFAGCALLILAVIYLLIGKRLSLD